MVLTAVEQKKDYDKDLIQDQHFLRMKTPPKFKFNGRATTVCDLFSGVGGMSLGAKMALANLGRDTDFRFIVENDLALAKSYQNNFGTEICHIKDIFEILDLSDYETQNQIEREWVKKVGSIDVLLAGPPCQGHSDLNNHTRRNDPRNALLKSVAKAIHLLNPTIFFIENVQGIRKDKSGAFDSVVKSLSKLGYNITSNLYYAPDYGIPQNRRRCFIIGTKREPTAVQIPIIKSNKRDVAWAIRDLEHQVIEGVTFESPSKHFPQNQKRIDILHDLGIYELPNEYRPKCHRDKQHAYNSVYSRMSWDKIAPTITCGFGSIGQGRFGHPSRRSGITPHEASRIQSFPDFFDFSGLNRGQLQKAIGNAVPPLMFTKLATSVLNHETW